MPLVIGVTKEFTPGERRVALVPDVAKKYQGLGAALLLQAGAGESAYYRDADYGVSELATDRAAVLQKADLFLQVQPLGLDALEQLKPGSVLVDIAVDQAHVDGNLVTAPAWPAHPAWLAAFLKVLG